MIRKMQRQQMFILLAARPPQSQLSACMERSNTLHQAVDMRIRRPFLRAKPARQGGMPLSHPGGIRPESPQLPLQRRKYLLHRAPLFDDFVQY